MLRVRHRLDLPAGQRATSCTPGPAGDQSNDCRKGLWQIGPWPACALLCSRRIERSACEKLRSCGGVHVKTSAHCAPAFPHAIVGSRGLGRQSLRPEFLDAELQLPSHDCIAPDHTNTSFVYEDQDQKCPCIHARATEWLDT